MTALLFLFIAMLWMLAAFGDGPQVLLPFLVLLFWFVARVGWAIRTGNREYEREAPKRAAQRTEAVAAYLAVEAFDRQLPGWENRDLAYRYGGLSPEHRAAVERFDRAIAYVPEGFFARPTAQERVEAKQRAA